MAIDSAAKRKSIAAISLICVGPVVVPDGTIGLFDRQVVGYGYGGIEAGDAADNTAHRICIRNAALKIASASESIKIAAANATIGC